MKRFLFLVASVSLIGLMLNASPGSALDKCKAKIKAQDGTIYVQANGVVGTLRWGQEAGQENNSFADPGCVSNGSARQCTLGLEGTPAAITPPPLCRIHLVDDNNDSCSAFIKKCTPGLREAPTLPSLSCQTYSASATSASFTIGVNVSCESGRITGGGCFSTSSSVVFGADYPFSLFTWHCRAANPTGLPIEVFAYASARIDAPRRRWRS